MLQKHVSTGILSNDFDLNKHILDVAVEYAMCYVMCYIHQCFMYTPTQCPPLLHTVTGFITRHNILVKYIPNTLRHSPLAHRAGQLMTLLSPDQHVDLDHQSSSAPCRFRCHHRRRCRLYLCALLIFYLPSGLVVLSFGVQ